MNVTALATSAVTQGQAAAEGLMTDTCTITRGGTRTFDDATGGYTVTGGTTVYTGKCRVKPRDVLDRQVEAGDRPVQIWPYVVSVPIAESGPTVNDLVTVDASADAALVNVQMVVKDVARGSQITARRLGCNDQET